MKIGDAIPPAIAGAKPCPRCKKEVFKTYSTGFANEVDIVIASTSNGFTIQEQWHCPGCGLREYHNHDVDSDGLRVKATTNDTISSDSITDSSTATKTIYTDSNSSDKPKKKKRNYKT